jgi:hypothetical protein
MVGLGVPERGDPHTGHRPHFHSWGWLAASHGSFDEAGLKLACRLLDPFPVLPILEDTADLAAALRRTNRWRLPDALQAAAAQLNGLVLATRNMRDFPPGRYAYPTTPYRLE